MLCTSRVVCCTSHVASAFPFGLAQVLCQAPPASGVHRRCVRQAPQQRQPCVPAGRSRPMARQRRRRLLRPSVCVRSPPLPSLQHVPVGSSKRTRLIVALRACGFAPQAPPHRRSLGLIGVGPGHGTGQSAGRTLVRFASAGTAASTVRFDNCSYARHSHAAAQLQHTTRACAPTCAHGTHPELRRRTRAHPCAHRHTRARTRAHARTRTHNRYSRDWSDPHACYSTAVIGNASLQWVTVWHQPVHPTTCNMSQSAFCIPPPSLPLSTLPLRPPT